MEWDEAETFMREISIAPWGGSKFCSYNEGYADLIKRVAPMVRIAAIYSLFLALRKGYDVRLIDSI